VFASEQKWPVLEAKRKKNQGGHSSSGPLRSSAVVLELEGSTQEVWIGIIS
jgi:hypothetical protein